MDIYFYSACAVVIILTGISKSGFAGGLGVITIPVMSLFIAPQLAVAIILPILCVMDVANIWKYRNQWVLDYVMLLIPGALFGLVLGVITFRWVNADLLNITIGLLVLCFVVHYAVSKRLSQSMSSQHYNPTTRFLVGGLSGWASFVAHAGGPPIKGFLLSQHMDKSQFVATNSFFCFLINLLKIPPYFLLGQFSWQTLSMSVLLLPFVPVGVLIGFYLHRMVDQQRFTHIVYGLLLLAGLKLLWDGAVALMS